MDAYVGVKTHLCHHTYALLGWQDDKTKTRAFNITEQVQVYASITCYTKAWINETYCA